MAIVKLDSPVATSPATFVSPVVAQLAALGINVNHGPRIAGGYVREGAIINIGGTWFVAESDTAISGASRSAYVKFTVAGTSATAAFVSESVFHASATWDGAYQGFYDGSGDLYMVIDGYQVADDLYTVVCDAVSATWTQAQGASQKAFSRAKSAGTVMVKLTVIAQSLAGSVTGTIYKNGAATAITASSTLPGSTTNDDIGEIAVEAGDIISIYGEPAVSGSATCNANYEIYSGNGPLFEVLEAVTEW